jgi:hypothetical protein
MIEIYKLLKEIKSRTGCFCIDISLGEGYGDDIDTSVDVEDLSTDELVDIVESIEDILTITIYHDDHPEPLSAEVKLDRIEDFDMEKLLLEIEIQLDRTHLYYHNTSNMIH